MVSYERLPMLEIVFDRLVRLMTTSLRNFTSDNVEVSLDRITSVRFGDYMNSIPLPAVLAVFKAEEWENFALATVDSSLIYSMIDVLLGGRRGQASLLVEGRPYTTIETNLVKRLVEVVLPAGRVAGARSTLGPESRSRRRRRTRRLCQGARTPGTGPNPPHAGREERARVQPHRRRTAPGAVDRLGAPAHPARGRPRARESVRTERGVLHRAHRVDAPEGAAAGAVMAAKRLNPFERYLSLWVGLCMIAGVALGVLAPSAMAGLRQLEFGDGSQINIPIAILIWLMITPMMMKVDFGAIRNVGRRPRGLFVTLCILISGDPHGIARAEAFGQLYEQVPAAAAQRAIRFWKVRAGSASRAA